MKYLILTVVLTLSTVAAQSQVNLTMLSEEELYDKVLGALVGSAVGDAMGASTEMWSREDRVEKYGYIDDLTAPEITPSAEGVWDEGYPAGATTDDTRWKKLIGQFIVNHVERFYDETGPDPNLLADHILDYYEEQVENLNKLDADTSVELAERKLNWIIEWAEVAEAYKTGDIHTYNIALAKFYGGYQLTAGMLYGPMFGIPYPGNPEKAYTAAFNLALFDHGYARDMTALSAAMVSEAMAADATQESILSVFERVDPYGFHERRIFSREANETLKRARSIANSTEDELEVWEKLDLNLQDVSPHAQEILFLTLTAMIYSDFEYMDTIRFLVNYGRDNDTTAALAGVILGAFHGYENLPQQKAKVIEVAKEVHDIDLVSIAESITAKMLQL